MIRRKDRECVSEYVCVCVCEREREGEEFRKAREIKGGRDREKAEKVVSAESNNLILFPDLLMEFVTRCARARE